MDRNTLLIAIFCLIDDWLNGQRVRTRGPLPTLYDSDAAQRAPVTIEAFGAFLGIATDVGIYSYFRAHFADYFPRLRAVDRTTFARHAANLWGVKQRLWQHLLTRVAYDPAVSIVDSCPVPVCQFARARRCRRLREYAAYGKDELVRQTYYGLRFGHPLGSMRICWPGVIVSFNLVAANEPDLPVAESGGPLGSILPGVRGWALADRGYWKAGTISDLAARGLSLLTPYKDKKRERAPWPSWLIGKRRRIETVLGQLVERYRLKRIWARDAWHLWSRWLRCVVSHTLAVLLCQQQGLSPLQFDALLTD
jgi:hypothetical protein